MNNDQAMEVLKAHKVFIDSSIDAMNEYTKEVVTKTKRMAAIKASAAEAGVDISAWDGKAAPVPEDIE